MRIIIWSLILLITSTPSITAYALDIPYPGLQIETNQLQIQAKQQELFTLVFDDKTGIEFEELDVDISQLSATGNEELQMVQRGIDYSTETPTAYWIIYQRNIADLPEYGNSGVKILAVTEESETELAFIEYDRAYVQEDSSGQYQLTDGFDPFTRYPPGWEGYFKISFPIEHPQNTYLLVNHIDGTDFAMEVYGMTEYNEALRSNDAALNLIVEIEELERANKVLAQEVFDLEKRSSLQIQSTESNLDVSDYAGHDEADVTIVRHGFAIVDEIPTVFWVLRTKNISSKRDFSARGVWPFQVVQEQDGKSTSVLTNVDYVEYNEENDDFYPSELYVHDTKVNPGWEGHYVIHTPVEDEDAQYYLVNDALDIRFKLEALEENPVNQH